MQINMTSAAARLAAAQAYEGGSKPLSELRPGDRINSPAWWETGPKNEGFNRERHSAALQLYLTIAAHAQSGVPAHCFPASFRFGDGARLRPDKGSIKAALRNDVIRAVPGDELLFELTPAGRAHLFDQSPSQIDRYRLVNGILAGGLMLWFFIVTYHAVIYPDAHSLIALIFLLLAVGSICSKLPITPGPLRERVENLPNWVTIAVVVLAIGTSATIKDAESWIFEHSGELRIAAADALRNNDTNKAKEIDHEIGGDQPLEAAIKRTELLGTPDSNIALSKVWRIIRSGHADAAISAAFPDAVAGVSDDEAGAAEANESCLLLTTRCELACGIALMSDADNPDQAKQLVVEYVTGRLNSTALAGKHFLDGCNGFLDPANRGNLVDVARHLAGSDGALENAAEIAAAEQAAFLPLNDLQASQRIQSSQADTMGEIVDDTRASDLGLLLGREKAAAFLDHQANDQLRHYLQTSRSGTAFEQAAAAEKGRVEALRAADKDGRWLAWKATESEGLNPHVVVWAKGLHKGEDNPILANLIGYEVPVKTGVVACIWFEAYLSQSCGLFDYDGRLIAGLW